MTNKVTIHKLKILISLAVVFTFYFLLSFSVFAQGVLPPGEPITYGKVNTFLDNTAKFLYTAGITLAVITLVVSGIMYFTAGSDTEAKKAKGWFKNGIMGVLIILGTGVIIKTIEVVVRGGFFTGP